VSVRKQFNVEPVFNFQQSGMSCGRKDHQKYKSNQPRRDREHAFFRFHFLPFDEYEG
jgi:hypothetical protein